MSNSLIDKRVVVLCNNSNGSPEFHTCIVKVTAAEVEDGKHYVLAVEDAEEHGYDAPMIPFANTDPAAKQLGDVHLWIGI